MGRDRAAVRGQRARTFAVETSETGVRKTKEVLHKKDIKTDSRWDRYVGMTAAMTQYLSPRLLAAAVDSRLVWFIILGVFIICLSACKVTKFSANYQEKSGKKQGVLYLIVTTVTDCLNLGAKEPGPIAPSY